MRESQFTSNVHKRLTPDVYAWKINDNYTIGVADAFYRTLQGEGKPLWIEYKYLQSLPKKASTVIKPKLSEKQILFLKQAQTAGEVARVIVGYKSKGVIFTLDELEGITCAEFESRLSDYKTLARSIFIMVNTKAAA